MTLEENINELSAKGKLNEALDLLLPVAAKEDKDIHNTLIILKSRHSGNENDFNKGIISVDDHRRSKAQILQALLQTMAMLDKSILKAQIPGDDNKTSKNNNAFSQKELKGLQSQLNLLEDKKLVFENELIITYDAAKKFALKQQIKDMEKQIVDLKNKIITCKNSQSDPFNLSEKEDISINTAKKIFNDFIDTPENWARRNRDLEKVKYIEPAEGRSAFSGKKFFKAMLNDGKGILIMHAEGIHAKKIFYVRKGIGYYYRKNFDKIDEYLGLPVSHEHKCGPAGINAKSDFENGFIEWIAGENALYIYCKVKENIELLEKHQF